MGCKTSFDCKQLAWCIKDVDSNKWDAVARSLCEKGIREKFLLNPHLMQVLIEKTANKTIVECANDRLWGNGKALSEESCLNRDVWISQGILGQILENVRAEFASSRPPMPAYPALNGSSMMHLRPPPLVGPSTYNSMPLHTMTLTPAVFCPTQVPPKVSERTITTTAVVEPASSDPINAVVHPHPNPTRAHNREDDN